MTGCYIPAKKTCVLRGKAESRCIANAHRILLLAREERPVVAEDFDFTVN